MRTQGSKWLTAVAALGALLTLGETAHAVVGRPLTPMSYAGVARRTTRRAAYAGAAYGAYRPYGYGAYGAGSLYALPAGCAVGLPCGGIVYRPVYQGTTVVYVPQ